MVVEDDTEKLPGLPLVPVGTFPDGRDGLDVEIVSGDVDRKFDHNAGVIVGEMIDDGHVVHIVHSDDRGAVLEGQVVVDVLADLEGVLAGSSGIDPAGLGPGDVDAGAVAVQFGDDLLNGGLLKNVGRPRSSMKTPLLK